jgi:NAD(P)-dependent dehydrogenase (short-subunit alcohol dehydrogenase family)
LRTRRRTGTSPPCTPLGRADTPAEVADTAAFLLSAQAGFINGVILPVDGGRSASGPDPEAI